MPQNKIVVRYLDGRTLKGFTNDFLPTRPHFHVSPADAPPGTQSVTVRVAELKAVFFVRSHKGDPNRVDSHEFHPKRPVVGKKIRVVFTDGETIAGTTQGYDPSRQGFFINPAGLASNNERCFIVVAATKEITAL